MSAARHRIASAALALAAGSGAIVLAPTQPAWAIAISHQVRVLTRGTDSAGGQMPGGSYGALISSNGRWMAWSNANGAGSWRKDLLSGTTVPVALNDADQPANSPQIVVGISTDGTKVAFVTSSSNMGQGTATIKDVYVRDVPGGTTTRANINVGGSAVPVYGGHAALSDDGKVVAFNLSTGPTVVRTLATGVSERVDVSSAEIPGNGQSDQVTLSATGRFVAFASASTNLVANDTNAVYDVFVRDRQAGTTERVSLGDGGQVSAGSYQPSISANGRYVAFMSTASDVVAGDTNNQWDIFRRDRTLLTTYRVNVSSNGTQTSNAGSFGPDVSDDGRYVAFGTSASNISLPLVGGNRALRRDLDQGITIQVGLRPDNTPGNSTATFGSMSADGSASTFTSDSNDLVTNDTNQNYDTFVDHLVSIGPFTTLTAFSNRQVTDFGAPEASKAAHAADVYNGRTSPEHLIVSMAHSSAWAQHRQPVARLYQAFFHREPDLNGLNYWVNKHANGTKLSKIAAFFAASSEFATAYGNVTNTDFVKLVYGNVLQRKPDAAGLAHWKAKLDGGMSRGDLMVAFSESSEGGRVLAPEVDSVLIGLGMLGAMPPKALYEQAAAAHRSTGVPEGAAAVYTASSQYASKVGP